MLRHNVSIRFVLFFPPTCKESFAYTVWRLAGFHGIPECVKVCVSGMCFLSFPWLFFLFGCFVIFQFACFWFILLYYYYLDACLVSKKRQKGYGAAWDVRGGGTGRSRGREYYNRNILKKLFNKKGKMNYSSLLLGNRMTGSEKFKRRTK